jgi:hypothetical protein
MTKETDYTIEITQDDVENFPVIQSQGRHNAELFKRMGLLDDEGGYHPNGIVPDKWGDKCVCRRGTTFNKAKGFRECNGCGQYPVECLCDNAEGRQA